MPAGELGWRGLPPGATPAQKALAESLWRPAPADASCRCTSPCRHGAPCELYYVAGHPDRCPGRLVHVDRTPRDTRDGNVTLWDDEYQCDQCGDMQFGGARLPGVPWAETTLVQTPGGPRQVITPFPGTRHPLLTSTGDLDKPSLAGWPPLPGERLPGPETAALVPRIIDTAERAARITDPQSGLEAAAVAVEAALAPLWARVTTEIAGEVMAYYGTPGSPAWTPAAASAAGRARELYAAWRKPGGAADHSPGIHPRGAAGQSSTLKVLALLAALCHSTDAALRPAGPARLLGVRHHRRHAGPGPGKRPRQCPLVFGGDALEGFAAGRVVPGAVLPGSA